MIRKRYAKEPSEDAKKLLDACEQVATRLGERLRALHDQLGAEIGPTHFTAVAWAAELANSHTLTCLRKIQRAEPPVEHKLDWEKP